jgi:hypothetical protein
MPTNDRIHWIFLPKAIQYIPETHDVGASDFYCVVDVLKAHPMSTTATINFQ